MQKIKSNFLQDKAFEKLFDKGQKIIFQHKVKARPTILTYPFEQKMDYEFFVLNPIKEGATERKQENILYAQGLTIESDCTCLNFQKEFHDFVFPVGPTVSNFSGNKSIHFHWRFSRPLEAQEHERIIKYLKMAFPFADYSVLSDISRLCRVPNGLRNGKLQEIQDLGQRTEPQEFLNKLEQFCKKYGLKDIPEVAHNIILKKNKTLPNLVKIVQDFRKNGYDLKNSDFGKLVLKGLSELAEKHILSEALKTWNCNSKSIKNNSTIRSSLTPWNQWVNEKLQGIRILDIIPNAQQVSYKEEKITLCCPIHDDHNPSAWITKINGIEIIHCSADSCELKNNAKNALDLKRLMENKDFRTASKELFGEESPIREQEPPMEQNNGQQFGNFIVNDQGIFMHKINKDNTIENELIYNQPIRIKNSIELIDSCDQNDPLRITLEFEHTEKIVKASDLCKKNIDQLCDKGIFIFDSKKINKLCEYFNEAVKNIPRKRMYKVLGWHGQEFIIPGLVDTGLLLEKSNYCVKDCDIQIAVDVVKQLINVTKNKTFLPLFLFSLLAPAAEKLGLNTYRFALFCQGQTGNFKTTLSRYAIAIYGEEMFNDFIRFSEGATINGLIAKCSLAGDLPILIDNFKPNLREGETGLIHIISTLVEGRDKIRCNTKGEIKNPIILKSWPIITGETGIETDTSAIARCLELEFEKTPDALKYLSFAEQNKHTLCSIGYHWIQFLKKCNTQSFKEQWPAIMKKWEMKCCKEGIVNSSRVAANCSCLELVFQIAQKCNGLDFLAEHEKNLEQILSGLLINMGQTTTEAREGLRFLIIIRQLLETDRVSLMANNGYNEIKKNLSGIESNVPAIGWLSKEGNILFLYPDLAIDQVKKIGDFKITKNALFKQLDEMGILIKKSTKSTRPKRIAGKLIRVLALDYAKFKEETYEPINYNANTYNNENQNIEEDI